MTPEGCVSGQRFGRLVAMWPAGQNIKRSVVWLCCCSCGSLTLIPANKLRFGSTKSCGCLSRELAAERARLRNTSHGMRNTPEYRCWRDIISRCTLVTHPAYKNYGGRGIVVCERWRAFVNFIADVGLRPSSELSIDRIDNNGNYEPGNVRWATRSQQIKNTRTRKRVHGRFTSETENE